MGGIKNRSIEVIRWQTLFEINLKEFGYFSEGLKVIPISESFCIFNYIMIFFFNY